MFPTASFSTGKKYVPTGSILIAFNWFDDNSTTASDGAALEAALDLGGGFAPAG
jgi:hypothetical protein